MTRQRQRGFTLVELLIVVVIIGLISAIAIPAVTHALKRARQKRSMTEMRNVALAVSAYAIDLGIVPALAEAPADDLKAFLAPTYIRRLGTLDGWSRPYQYAGTGLDYTLSCLGEDGLPDNTAPRGATTNFNDDIIILNGAYVQWPDGVQK